MSLYKTHIQKQKIQVCDEGVCRAFALCCQSSNLANHQIENLFCLSTEYDLAIEV